ncbi:MAG TPA: glycosyltransferase [Ktedonobacterales bacterium]
MSMTMPGGGDAGANAASAPSVAYLLKRYPRLSETFILHEMLALEARGARLRVYSMMNPAEPIVHPDIQRLAAPVEYLPQVSLRYAPTLARAHARLLWRAPLRYLRALGRALSRRDPLAGLRHFLRGGWLGLELERHGIRHLHAHFAHGPAATAQFVSLLAGIPFSFTAHAKDIYTTPRERVAERIREARFVVTCTGHNYIYLAHLVDDATAKRIHRIYHGVDLERFQLRGAPIANGGRPPLILAVGRLVEKKGLSYLVEACALLQSRGAAFRCQIVGSGPLKRDLEEQTAAAGLNGRVELLGARTQEELVGIYQEAMAVALPSVILENGDRDGIPNVLVEAMSMGIPVVATSVSGIPELIEDGRDGLLVEPRQPERLADALDSLLNDKQLRERLGANAHETVSARFDLARNAAYLEDCFTRALTSPIDSPVVDVALANELERTRA